PGHACLAPYTTRFRSRSGAVAEVGWLMVAAVGLLAALEAARGCKVDPQPSALNPSLAWLGLATGVALAHHRSGALALPGIALARSEEHTSELQSPDHL